MASDQEQFRLVSPSIDHEGRLPRKHTEEGQGAQRNLSPPLEWFNVPQGTLSLALVVEDIDAPDPSGPIVPWATWVVSNIGPTLKGLPKGFSGKEEQGVREGNIDHKVRGWRGPKLPSHGHRFKFTLYALDEDINFAIKPATSFEIMIKKLPYLAKLRLLLTNFGTKITKESLQEAIQGHVLAEAVLTAVF